MQTLSILRRNAECLSLMYYTFKCFSGTGCMVFIWMKLKSQLSVGFFQILLRGFFTDTKSLIIVLTPLNSAPERQITV